MDYRDGVDLLTITENRSRTQQERKGKMRKKICVLLLSVLAIIATPHASWGLSVWRDQLTIETLVDAFDDALRTGFAQQIVSSYTPFAGCSAIWEIYRKMRGQDRPLFEGVGSGGNLGSNWVDEALGVSLTDMTPEVAADFCLYNMNFNTWRVNPYQLCPYNSTCTGDYLDAALGCMFAMMGYQICYNPDVYGPYVDEPGRWCQIMGALDNAIRNQMDIDTARDTMSELFCTSNNNLVINGSFWDFVDPGPDVDWWDYGFLENTWREKLNDNFVHDVSTSDQPLAACAGMYETWRTLVDYGPDWWGWFDITEDYGIVADKYPDFDGMDTVSAIAFCTDVMGFDWRRTDNPCGEYGEFGCVGTWEDAMAGCVALLTGYSDSGMSELTDLVSASVAEGNLWAAQDLSALFCANSPDFWDQVITDTMWCYDEHRADCQVVDVVMQSIAHLWFDGGTDSISDLFYEYWDAGWDTGEKENLAAEIAVRILERDSIIGDSSYYDEISDSTLSEIILQYGDCWRDNFLLNGGPEFLMVFSKTNPADVQEYINNVMNICAQDFGATFCYTRCFPQWCEDPGQWGSYMCQDCPELEGNVEWYSNHKVFVGGCGGTWASGVFSDRTGTYERPERRCDWIVD